MIAYVNEFAQTTWQDAPDSVRSLACVCAELVSFLRPGTNADLLAHDLEGQWRSQGQRGPVLDVTPALVYLKTQGASVLDLSSLVAGGNASRLRGEIRAQAACGIVHLVCVRDESQLALAGRNVSLHGYTSDAGIPHALLYVGNQDSDTDLYYDSAAPAFVRPTPIAWESLQRAGITAVYGVLPVGVEMPPADFHFYEVNQYGQPVTHVWPVPVAPVAPTPDFDPSPVLSALSDARTPLASARDALANWQTQPFSALPALIEHVAQQLASVDAAHTQVEAALQPHDEEQ